MLAPRNEELMKLRAEDPTLERRIKKAYAQARRNGHERYSFVKLKNGKILRVETLNASKIGSKAKKKKSGRSGLSAAKSFLSIFGL